MEREALHPLHEGEVADAAPTRRMIGHGPLADATSYRNLLVYLIPLMRQPEPEATQALHYFVFVYRVIQRECGLKTVRNRECQGSRRGDLGWTVGFTRIVSMVTVRQ